MSWFWGLNNILKLLGSILEKRCHHHRRLQRIWHLLVFGISFMGGCPSPDLDYRKTWYHRECTPESIPMGFGLGVLRPAFTGSQSPTHGSFFNQRKTRKTFRGLCSAVRINDLRLWSMWKPDSLLTTQIPLFGTIRLCSVPKMLLGSRTTLLHVQRNGNTNIDFFQDSILNNAFRSLFNRFLRICRSPLLLKPSKHHPIPNSMENLRWNPQTKPRFWKRLSHSNPRQFVRWNQLKKSNGIFHFRFWLYFPIIYNCTDPLLMGWTNDQNSHPIHQTWSYLLWCWPSP